MEAKVDNTKTRGDCHRIHHVPQGTLKKCRKRHLEPFQTATSTPAFDHSRHAVRQMQQVWAKPLDRDNRDRYGKHCKFRDGQGSLISVIIKKSGAAESPRTPTDQVCQGHLMTTFHKTFHFSKQALPQLARIYIQRGGNDASSSTSLPLRSHAS